MPHRLQNQHAYLPPRRVARHILQSLYMTIARQLQHRQEIEKTKQKFMKEAQGLRHRQPTKKAKYAPCRKGLTLRFASGREDHFDTDEWQLRTATFRELHRDVFEHLTEPSSTSTSSAEFQVSAAKSTVRLTLIYCQGRSHRFANGEVIPCNSNEFCWKFIRNSTLSVVMDVLQRQF